MNIDMLHDQKRLHLQHGPIDLIVEAFGASEEIAKAYYRASQRFQTILDELVNELPLLRTPVRRSSFPRPPSSFPRKRESRADGTDICNSALDSRFRGNDKVEITSTIARSMYAAVEPHAADFITPMAAVAGAVADEVLKALCRDAKLDKAYVNNGGDIALYINRQTDETFCTGIVSDPHTGQIVTTATIKADTGIKGIATSGRHGRSHSFGIADSVTVFAENAAIADAAATIIANKIDLADCQQIERRPANQLSPDSDLGSQLVTVKVGELTSQEIATALAAGQEQAQNLYHAGVINAAFLCLQGDVRVVDRSIDAPPVFAPHSASQTSLQTSLHTTQDRISHA